MPTIFSPECFGQVTLAENFPIKNTVESADLNQRFSLIYPDKTIHFSPMSQTASRITALKIYSTILMTLGLAFLSNSFRNCYNLYSQNLFIVLTPKFEVTPTLTPSAIPHLRIRINHPELEEDNPPDLLNEAFCEEFPRSHNGTPSATSAVGSTPDASSETSETFDRLGAEDIHFTIFGTTLRSLPRLRISPIPASEPNSIGSLSPISFIEEDEDEGVQTSSAGHTPRPSEPARLLSSGFLAGGISPDGVPDLSSYPPAFAMAGGRPVFVPQAVTSKEELMEFLASKTK